MIVPICLPGALEVGHVPLGSWKKEPRDKGTALKTCLSLLSQRTSKWKSMVTTLIVELLNKGNYWETKKENIFLSSILRF